MARGVGPPARLAQQRLPLRVGQAAAVPVGARILPTVIEETDVVVLLLERPNLTLDELVELIQVVGEVFGNVEIHHDRPNVGLSEERCTPNRRTSIGIGQVR